MTDEEIKALANKVYPENIVWVSTPERPVDQNAKERRCWIEGYKAAMQEVGGWTDEEVLDSFEEGMLMGRGLTKARLDWLQFNNEITPKKEEYLKQLNTKQQSK